MKEELIQFSFKRGDSFSFKSKLTLKSGQEIKKEDISELYVTVREGFDEIFPIIFQKTLNDVDISDGYVHINFNPEDTENLLFDEYCFDLEITLKTSPIIRKTKTGTFTLLGETSIRKNGSVVD